MKHAILIIDDQPDMLHLLSRTLAPELDARIVIAGSADEALKILEQDGFDLVLSDIKMPGMDGLELLRRIKDNRPDQTVVMMTAFGSIDMVIHAMKIGAYDFITKPFDHDTLVVSLKKALERSSLLKENRMLQRSCFSGELHQDLVGKSVAMKKVYETITMVAGTDVTILITGESGTGKNLVARAIHGMSERRSGPFITVNCPTVPEAILESELFGYKKGAFTHATGNKSGLFQEAENGTIFLDEIGEISPSIQTKLLRVLQDKEIKPLGDTRVIRVNTRIIASTNQNLPELIRKGLFREDFYYRLNVLPITMPPLRERVKDIPLISNHLLEKHCQKLGKPMKSLSQELLDALMANPWEGNIRELENVIIRGILYSESSIITVADAGLADSRTSFVMRDAAFDGTLSYKDAKEKSLIEFNKRFLSNHLNECQGNISQAARNMGLERQALQQIMKRFDIRGDDFRKE
ncbi:MAG: sigma-54 dependent transcriptional regulator [Desulfobacteraceae bacterium]|jgi:DNA-binding NtrC family response regulator